MKLYFVYTQYDPLTRRAICGGFTEAEFEVKDLALKNVERLDCKLKKLPHPTWLRIALMTVDTHKIVAVDWRDIYSATGAYIEKGQWIIRIDREECILHGGTSLDTSSTATG